MIVYEFEVTAAVSELVHTCNVSLPAAGFVAEKVTLTWLFGPTVPPMPQEKLVPLPPQPPSYVPSKVTLPLPPL